MSGFLDPLLVGFTWKFILIIGYFQAGLIGHSFSGVFVGGHVVLGAFTLHIGSFLGRGYTFYEFIHFIKEAPNQFTPSTLSPSLPTNI